MSRVAIAIEQDIREAYQDILLLNCRLKGLLQRYPTVPPGSYVEVVENYKGVLRKHRCFVDTVTVSHEKGQVVVKYTFHKATPEGINTKKSILLYRARFNCNKRDKMNIRKILKKHNLWLNNEESGERANLQDANLRGAYLQYANLRGADLRGADLEDAYLQDAYLRGADLEDANLQYANLQDANLRGADLEDANLQDANLRGANLQDANLRGANLRGAYLEGANLSSAKGLLSASAWMADNFEHTKDGYVVYKTFGMHYRPPVGWTQEPGAVIEEVPNPCRVNDCGCGVNFATLSWVKAKNAKRSPIWECLLKWEDLPDVVVPYHTDGKVRCAKLTLIKQI